MTWTAALRTTLTLLGEVAEHGLFTRHPSPALARLRSQPIGMAALLATWAGMCALMIPVMVQGRSLTHITQRTT